MGDMRVTEVLDPRDLLPGSFAAKRVLQMPETSRSINRDSCAWSCGVLIRLFRGACPLPAKRSWAARGLRSSGLEHLPTDAGLRVAMLRPLPGVLLG